MQYKPKDIEQKWQKRWEEEKTFSTPADATSENKYYILPQLPYPSGSGLHVGHAEVYTACDILSRFKRMQGEKVLQVIGWDSFGLPAENYAIKTNVHPKESTENAVNNFRSQIKSLGISVDWDREVGSHTPEYYKWTQWLFQLMYKRGLAYRKKQAVNWCESCKTVLANEQVVDGHCERCDTVVIQKEMEQWYLRITDYADRLLEGLDRIDWPEETKKRQRDWIGRSEGASIRFNVIASGAKQSTGSDEEIAASLTAPRNDSVIEVFTTRPDTIFGATYMVLAPEHALVASWISQGMIENAEAVQAYIDATAKKTDLDRQIDQEKTGVELQGIKAINPVNGEETPVWIADYVLASYGTGAIMAVPAHDERDFAFAKKFGLEIKQVVAEIVNSPDKDAISRDSAFGVIENKSGEVLVLRHKASDYYRLPGGGIEDGENIVDSLFREIREETGYIDLSIIGSLGATQANYYNFVKDEYRSGIKNGYLLRLRSENNAGQAVDDEVDFELLWVTPKKALELFRKNKESWGEEQFIERHVGMEMFVGTGITINSDFLDGKSTNEAKEAIITWLEEHGVGTRKVNYKLRDWSVSRQRFWGAPIPAIRNKKQEIRNKDGAPERVVHVHAWGANPKSNFRTWLDDQEETLGIQSVTPELPNSDFPVQEEWFAAVDEVLTEETTDTVLEGRSLGCFTALQLAEQKEFRKLILIAPTLPIDEWKEQFKSVVSDTEQQETVLSFVDADLDYERIQENVGEVVVFLSTNDPYIPLEASEKFLAEHLPFARIIRVREAGHFGTDDGFTTFPQLFEEIVRPVRNDLRMLPVSDLPVRLPDDVDFKPTGQSPLTYSETFQDGVAEQYGEGWQREVDTLDTFMCSSWYFFRYLDPHNDQAFASEEALKKWMPVDFYLGGAEHVNGHLLYSRFLTKVLYDAGYIDFDEPFTVHRHQGLILGEDGRKMSKRWGNVINPTDVVNEYGADTCRMYEMFMGPLEETKPWDTNGVKGVRRFLDRIWRFVIDEETQTLSARVVDTATKEEDIMLHKTIKKVTEDTATLGFNTAIASMMEFVNFIYKQDTIARTSVEQLVLLLAPYAPHMAEELWEKLGNTESLAMHAWPTYDESKLVADTITIVVQVNGKVRDQLELAADVSKEDAEAAALASEKVQGWLDGNEPKKVIYVPGKLVSIVV